MSVGGLPVEWRLAIVTILVKGGRDELPPNSSVSAVCKLMERVIVTECCIFALYGAVS